MVTFSIIKNTNQFIKYINYLQQDMFYTFLFKVIKIISIFIISLIYRSTFENMKYFHKINRCKTKNITRTL